MDDQNSHYRRVIDFTRTAVHEIRSGTRTREIDDDRKALVDQVEVWIQPPGPQAAWIYRAIRLLADLSDRSGDYAKADRCIKALGSAAQLEAFLPPRVPSHGEREYELEWCLLQMAAALHRTGGTDNAEAIARRTLQRLSKDNSADAIELRIRAHYTIGRCLLITGRSKESEQHFGAALALCDSWCVADVDRRTAIAYASYQTAVVLSGLARSSLERGHLSPAQRHLSVASTLLRDSGDVITRSYIGFLDGCIKRQTGRTSEAIDTLESARQVFLIQGHTRLYARCTLELAHAYLNDEQYDKAETTLATAEFGLGAGHARSDPYTSLLWNGSRDLLKARIFFKRGNTGQSRESAEIALSKLGGNERRSRVSDEIAVAHAILGDVALSEEQFAEAIEIANRGLRARSGKPPANVVDHAWLLLVRAEAYNRRNKIGDVALGHHSLEQCRELPLENQWIKERLAKVENQGHFFIPLDTKDIDYKKWRKRLQNFLHERAKTLYPGDSKRIIAALNVSKNTPAKWTQEVDDGRREPGCAPGPATTKHAKRVGDD